MSIANRMANLRLTLTMLGRANVALGCRAALIAVLFLGCSSREGVRLALSEQPLTLRQPALYPETIEYDPKTDRFLLGSFREGAIYRVDSDGGVTRLVDDPRLCSVLGIAVDAERGQLWAVNADLGASTRPSAAGPKHLAAVGIYDLATGAALNYVDLAPLAAGAHLLNGIALDFAGNAYVTDSFSPIIYKIDAHGQASVFLRSEQFVGDGINLNGLVVHPDGYLLVVKKSDGSLFRVPLDNPTRFSRVKTETQFVGGDGLTLVGKKALLLIANQTSTRASNAAFSLTSDDGWLSAQLRASAPLGDVYPTTAARRGDALYAVYSKLNELIQAPATQKARLQTQAAIVQIGTVTH